MCLLPLSAKDSVASGGPGELPQDCEDDQGLSEKRRAANRTSQPAWGERRWRRGEQEGHAPHTHVRILDQAAYTNSLNWSR